MREVGIRFGQAGHLAATITLPDSQAGLGLVLPSAGLLHRVGPHRMHVRLARQAAARGLAAVRFDLPGIGDSLHSPHRGSYAVQELQAAQAAMDLLEQESGASRFVAAGLCSGADLACVAAEHDTRIAGLFLMEPHYYPGRWSPALRALRRLREYGPRGAIARLLQLAREQPPPAMHQPAEPSRIRPAAPLFAASLATLLERGAHLHLVYAGSSMGRLDLERHRRQVFGQLAGSPRFRVDLLPEADHLFTPIAQMRKLDSLFLALLERVAGPTPERVGDTGQASGRTGQPLALPSGGRQEVNRAAVALRPRASR